MVEYKFESGDTISFKEESILLYPSSTNLFVDVVVNNGTTMNTIRRDNLVNIVEEFNPTISGGDKRTGNTTIISQNTSGQSGFFDGTFIYITSTFGMEKYDVNFIRLDTIPISGGEFSSSYIFTHDTNTNRYYAYHRMQKILYYFTDNTFTTRITAEFQIGNLTTRTIEDIIVRGDYMFIMFSGDNSNIILGVEFFIIDLNTFLEVTNIFLGANNAPPVHPSQFHIMEITSDGEQLWVLSGGNVVDDGFITIYDLRNFMIPFVPRPNNDDIIKFSVFNSFKWINAPITSIILPPIAIDGTIPFKAESPLLYTAFNEEVIGLVSNTTDMFTMTTIRGQFLLSKTDTFDPTITGGDKRTDLDSNVIFDNLISTQNLIFNDDSNIIISSNSIFNIYSFDFSFVRAVTPAGHNGSLDFNNMAYSKRNGRYYQWDKFINKTGYWTNNLFDTFVETTLDISNGEIVADIVIFNKFIIVIYRDNNIIKAWNLDTFQEVEGLAIGTGAVNNTPTRYMEISPNGTELWVMYGSNAFPEQDWYMSFYDLTPFITPIS